MTTHKNALTGHFVGTLAEAEATLELAQWISEVADGTTEDVQQVAYYDGDGTPEDNVNTVSKPYTFTGLYDPENVAQKFIADLEFLTGLGRKIWYKQVLVTGEELSGPATVSNIVTRGGVASDFQPFSCVIKWDRTPTLTPAPPAPGN